MFSDPDVPMLASITEAFLEHCRVDLSFSAETIIKYRDSLRQLTAGVGNRPIADYTPADITRLKSWLLARDLGPSRQAGILFAARAFFKYCTERFSFEVLDPALIRPPKQPRREVNFLTPDEIERFVASIRITNYCGKPHTRNLRFRALAEVLLGTAMRISEALSLDRKDIDFVQREARIIGKGNKQRVVFFTDRALYWVGQYLNTRSDDHPAVFVCQGGGSRWKRTDIWRYFGRHRELSGISKTVTPHVLRHSAATALLFNGCPVGHIKEILGHERLETTCRYYLGLDRRAAKQAHSKYLVYEVAAAA